MQMAVFMVRLGVCFASLIFPYCTIPFHTHDNIQTTGIPHNANGVLKINPSTQEVSILAEGILPDGQWKWHGGLASSDCTKIIGFPNNAGELLGLCVLLRTFINSKVRTSSDSILVIDVKEQSVYLVGDKSILKSGTHRVPRDGRYKYLGGALTSDGRYAYLFPWCVNNASQCFTNDV